jgi:hypothetical protein
MQLLGVDSGGKINTAYIERLNLTIRNSLARFIRKSMYNFVKPHKSLRQRVDQGRKKWMKRTPAMAERLTDHVWTIMELMTFRVPIQ